MPRLKRNGGRPGKPYPMPPMKTFPAGEVWLKAAEANGIHMVPAAVGMASTQFKGRDACIYDGWCHVGCPIGALANPVVTYLGEARKGGAEVRALCTVTRVLTNQDGTRATGVEYYDAKKQKQTQEASVVILAAWSGQNPRILLNSATDKHPNGLANKNQLVGKFMMTHSVAGTWALFDEDITPYMGTIGAQFMSYDRYAKTSYPNAFGSAFTVAGAAMKTNDFAQSRGDLFGKDLAAFMKRAAKGITRITFFGEGLPQLENRIELVERQGRIRHAARQAHAQLQRRRHCAVERKLRSGHEGRQGHQRERSRGRGRGRWCRQATCTAAPSWAPTRPTP